MKQLSQIHSYITHTCIRTYMHYCTAQLSSPAQRSTVQSSAERSTQHSTVRYIHSYKIRIFLETVFRPSLVWKTPSLIIVCRYFTAAYSRALLRYETQTAGTQMHHFSTMKPRPTASPPATEDRRSPAAKEGKESTLQIHVNSQNFWLQISIDDKMIRCAFADLIHPKFASSWGQTYCQPCRCTWQGGGIRLVETGLALAERSESWNCSWDRNWFSMAWCWKVNGGETSTPNKFTAFSAGLVVIRRLHHLHHRRPDLMQPAFLHVPFLSLGHCIAIWETLIVWFLDSLWVYGVKRWNLFRKKSPNEWVQICPNDRNEINEGVGCISDDPMIISRGYPS